MRNSFFPGGIKSVQTPIEYEETNRDYVERLERQLAQYIALKIEQHRLDTENKLSLKTRWNKVFADKIKKNLFEIFENYKYRVRPISTHKEISPEELKQARIEIYNINEKLTTELAGFKIYGFPLNMPFISLEQIWEEIRATEVHNILMDNVEYVLAVSILPYRNYVLSVWVYVGVLYK